MCSELCFNGPVFSVIFANERGDLIVGLEDQIALLHLHDYLPPTILREVVQNDSWIDDLKETGSPFDPKVDIWNFYNQTDPKSKDLDFLSGRYE